MEIRTVHYVPAHPDLPHRLATSAEIDQVLGESLPPLLQHLGFESFPKKRRWVRAREPIRDVFEITRLKGAALVPRWGLSLDFVPHVLGESIRSHRANKSAVLDIVLDPVDFFASWERDWEISGLHGELGVRRDAARILPNAVTRALAWFARFGPENLVERIEEHRDARSGNRLGFENWLQQPLAYAFALARDGRTEQARATLDAWAERHVPARTARRLEALLANTFPLSTRTG